MPTLEHELREMAGRILENESRFYSLQKIAELLRAAADEIENLKREARAS